MQKNSQLKRTQVSNSLNSNNQQTLQLQGISIEQLINKIQENIINTSDSIKNKLQQFQYNELMSYKDDLFKTQEEFIQIRQQRNQDVIKSNIMNQKANVQQKFTIQMKKSIEMNHSYDQLKRNMKKMTEQETQLILEINYMKKKIDYTKKQGLLLDQQIQELKNKSKKSTSRTNLSKSEQQRKLFTQIVNKCDESMDNNICYMKSKQPQDKALKLEILQKSEKNRQKRLKQQIQNIKDYIQNIPLDLNFIEEKMFETLTESAYEQSQIQQDSVQEELNDQNENQCKQDEKQHNQQQTSSKQIEGLDEKQNNQSFKPTGNQKQQSNKKNKILMFPQIKQTLGLYHKKMSSKQSLKPPLLKNKNSNMSIKSKISYMSSLKKQNSLCSSSGNFSNLNSNLCQQLTGSSKSSFSRKETKSNYLLQSLLQSEQVKKYLYSVLFNNG